MIYKILTGTLPSTYAIADLYPYEMLYKLEACYPCVKKISKSDLYNKHICPSGIGIGCDKNGIKITVTYGEYDKRDRWQAMQAYSIGDKRIRDAVGKVYGYNWTNNLTKELREAFNEKGDYKNMKYSETAYISNDVEINIKKRVINAITVYIPLYIKAADAVEIYDAITGDGELRPYELLDDLKELYPYIKNIDRGEIDNDYIFIEDVGVFYEDTRVRIVVEYSKYSGDARHIGDKRIDLINILNIPKRGGNIAEDRYYTWRDINIHIRDGVIDYMKLYISSDLDQMDIYNIYDIITGYIRDDKLISEEFDIIVDKKKAIKKMYFYHLLDELKKYYPCLEGIHRNRLYDEQLYPKNVDVCCEDNAVKITVKYGYYEFARDSFGINLTEIYSSISSGHSKLFDHLKTESAEELKKRLNAIYGAPVCLKEFEKKYQETESAEELKKKIAAAYALPTFDDFDAITDELKDTYIKKNHDYGNSFDKSIDKFGLTAAVVRMNDKMERLSSLLNKDAKVDESIRDTVMDLANYCIMTAMYLDKKEKK